MYNGRFFWKTTPSVYRVDIVLPRIYIEQTKKTVYILDVFSVLIQPVYIQGGLPFELSTQQAFSGLRNEDYEYAVYNN